MQVRKAVITAASRASRHLPLQTLVDRDGESRTVLAILLREIAAARIERVCVVVHPGDEEAYAEAVSDPAGPVVFIPQENPRGYGDAILRAKNFIADEPFLHLVGDHLYVGGHCAAALVKMAEAEQCAVSAVRATHESLLSSFGVVGGQPEAGKSGVWRIDAVLEKPTPTTAEQKLIVAGMRAGHYLAFFGMHALTPGILPILEELVSVTPEATLSDSLAVLARKERYLAVQVPAERYDLGSRYGLLTSQLALALSSAHRDEVLSMLVQLLAADAARAQTECVA
jgi:UTP--glucose-1-phosphate uridylyltransferase